MKRIATLIALILIALTASSVQANNTRIGVNLDALAYYGPFSPRYNLADQVGGNYGAWDTSAGTAAATTNADGYPLSDALAYLWNPLVDWPAGNFTVSFQGSGTLTVNGVAITSAAPGQVNVDPANGGTMQLRFTNINASNPPSALVIVPPGVSLANATKWNPAFLKKIAPFTCLRFMDWTHTNNNPAVDWTNRATPTSSGWTGQYGVPWEDVIDLANNTAKDIWINVPANASSDYINQLAALFASHLNGTSHLYIEYSNEIWNGQFSADASVMAASQANSSLTATDQWARCYQQIALKDVQIGNAFKSAFGSRAAQVRPVFAGQAGNFWGIGQGLAFLQATYGNVNGIYAVAGAPYIMQSYDTAGESSQTILADLANAGLNASTQWVKSDVAIANQYGIPYVCYEGGNSLTGFNGINTAAKIAAQSDPAMGQLYTNYFNMLAQNNVALYNNYAFVSTANKWGGWGCWDTLATVSSPKGDALVAAALAGPNPPAEPAVALLPGGTATVPIIPPTQPVTPPPATQPVTPPPATQPVTPPPTTPPVTPPPATQPVTPPVTPPPATQPVTPPPTTDPVTPPVTPPTTNPVTPPTDPVTPPVTPPTTDPVTPPPTTDPTTPVSTDPVTPSSPGHGHHHHHHQSTTSPSDSAAATVDPATIATADVATTPAVTSTDATTTTDSSASVDSSDSSHDSNFDQFYNWVNTSTDPAAQDWRDTLQSLGLSSQWNDMCNWDF